MKTLIESINESNAISLKLNDNEVFALAAILDDINKEKSKDEYYKKIASNYANSHDSDSMYILSAIKDAKLDALQKRIEGMLK